VSRPLTAALQFALIAPAAVFLLAVLARSVGPPESEAAQTVVMWYSSRLWTLWVLLLALPISALLIGGATSVGGRQSLAGAGYGAKGAIAVATIAAGVILAVVVLHMLAN
jgi:hypothetical protein